MTIVRIMRIIPQSTPQDRYQIINAGTGEVIDNAQGAGFKSYEKAEHYVSVHKTWLLDASNKPYQPELNQLML